MATAPVSGSSRPTWEEYLLHPIDSCQTLVGKIAMAILSAVVGAVTLGLVHRWAGRRISQRKPPLQGSTAASANVAAKVLAVAPNPFKGIIEQIEDLRKKIEKGPLARKEMTSPLYQAYYTVYYGQLDVAQSVLQPKLSDDAFNAGARDCQKAESSLQQLKRANNLIEYVKTEPQGDAKIEQTDILKDLNAIIAALSTPLPGGDV
jgi:hypothetical protein